MGQKHSVFIRKGDTPTVRKLKIMEGADGNPLRIIPRIAAGDYITFGMCLLQDENGDQVELVKKDHRQDGTESVTQAIIKKWLTSGAAPTRTYQHLIECLRQSEMGALAEEIVNTTTEKGWIMQHGNSIKVIVNPDVPKSLLSLMEEYAEMLVVLRMTKLPEEKFTELTFFLSSYCQTSCCHCSTLNKVIEFLQEKMKIWIFNIDTLIAIKEKFNSSKATSSIERYKQYLEKFCSSALVKEFQDALEVQINNTSHDFDSIILKLDEVRTEDTLQNLRKLAYDIFGISSKALILIRTGIGCVCVTWLVPTSLVSTMRAMAEQRSEKYLANLGVLELVIGLRVVPNEEKFTVGDSYRKMIGAMNLEIQNLKSKNEELESTLKVVREAVRKEKSEAIMAGSSVPSIELGIITSGGDPLSRAPSMRDLLERVASNTMDKWYMMGLLLNVRQGQLKSITHENPVLCYSEVFSLWEKKEDPPFTWATIVNALRSPIVGENKLALDIEGWLKGDK